MSPTVALIINTASLDPLIAARKNMHRSACYSERATLLEEKVLPVAVGFDEVIVVGQFKPGDGYRYVPLPPRYRDRRDALWQRELGARYATSDLLVFTHDDHAPVPGFAKTLRELPQEGWDILCPQRVHGITGAVLNNGEPWYMGAHTVVMKRWVWAEVPWNILDTEYWDTSMTRLWKEAGATIAWTTELTHLDVEAAEGEA